MRDETETVPQRNYLIESELSSFTEMKKVRVLHKLDRHYQVIRSSDIRTSCTCKSQTYNVWWFRELD